MFASIQRRLFRLPPGDQLPLLQLTQDGILLKSSKDHLFRMVLTIFWDRLYFFFTLPDTSIQYKEKSNENQIENDELISVFYGRCKKRATKFCLNLWDIWSFLWAVGCQRSRTCLFQRFRRNMANGCWSVKGPTSCLNGNKGIWKGPLNPKVW